MKNILSLCLVWICSTHAIADDKELWKCSSSDGSGVVYVKEPVKDKKCKLISKVFSDIEITQFQKTLKRGDMSDKGLIVEVKPPLAKVQGKDVERWHRISDLSPSVE